METTEALQQDEGKRSKDIFRDKAQVLIGKSTLLGLSQAKFNTSPSHARKRNILERIKILLGSVPKLP